MGRSFWRSRYIVLMEIEPASLGIHEQSATAHRRTSCLLRELSFSEMKDVTAIPAGASC